MLSGLHGVVATQNQQQIAGFGFHLLGYTLKHILAIELIHTGFDSAILLHPGVNHTFGANLRATNVFRQLIQLFAGVCGAALGTYTTDIIGSCKDAKAFCLRLLILHFVEQILQLYKPHTEAGVGLV